MGGRVDSQITFLYYADLEPAARFYGQVLGLPQVADQGWAKIYQVGPGAFVGIVSGERGFHRPQPRNAVLLTLVVDDVQAWYQALQAAGVRILREPARHEDIGVECFFFEDPGGYALEAQRFLKPEDVQVFHRGERRQGEEGSDTSVD